ncbi:MAG: ABC transporter permease [Bacilli bacterium]
MAFRDAVKGKLSELYSFRHMYYSLVQRSLFGKYRNSALGFLWNFLTPAISILLFYIVFENFMGQNIDNYWAYLCVGMFPFQFMNQNLIGGASNITSNGGMVKKIYFPREILSLSQVTYTFIIFLISYGIVISLMIATGIFPTGGLLALPIIILTMFLFSLGTIMLTSSISVYSRDFEYLIIAFSRVLFWVTPIFYLAEARAGILYTIIWFNPLTYFVEGFHHAVCWGTMPSTGLLMGCVLISIVVFVIGALVFFKLKDGFAERI